MFVHWFVYRGRCSRREGVRAVEMRWSGLKSTGVYQSKRETTNRQ